MTHCTECWTEFVAGVTACSDCGGPLTPGPLPDERPRAQAASSAAGRAAAPIDTFFDKLPGEEAEFAARSLALEGIRCRLQCEGLVRERGPDRAPEAPIAATLPVSVYVAASDLERAREIVASMEHEDLVGESWSEEALADSAADTEPLTDRGEADDSATAAGADETDEVKPEGSTTRIMILVIVALAILLFMLRR